MSRKTHWESVYAARPTDRLGWYRPHLQTSTAWIGDLGLVPDAPIIDVGGGASTLVDDLLDAGYRNITVLDISEQALAATRARLGDRSKLVRWLNGDVTEIALPRSGFELWHDRAAFHFLTEPEDRERYRHQLLTALRPNGHLIIGTFAPEAPSTCSGLPVQRYDTRQLVDEIGPAFELVDHHNELHVTPGGAEQRYLFCLFRVGGPHPGRW